MTKLNLTAKDIAQERILAYLEENASDVLIEKINNGTAIEKDGKQLVNKKSLDGFMTYANNEARKLAEKSAHYACVDELTVYGWAIHYFEEDSIEGTLNNEDGTEYKPAVKTPTPKQTTTPITIAKPKQPSNGQTSLFDLIDAQLEKKDDNADTEETENEETEIDETEEEIIEVKEESPEVKYKRQGSKLYCFYMDIKEKYPQDIVIDRLGDFYEAFGQDAITLSKELDLTLTGRNMGLDERVPMVGFPYHVADVYMNKIRKKFNVVVIERENDVRRLTQIVKANDGNIVEIDTGEIISENNPYVEKLSALLDCQIKFVG
ncbi:MAG: hypothetical protein K2M75_00160 [Clostridia bacterium]|nr:hypothetical protein [Clostridia bacterium]